MSDNLEQENIENSDESEVTVIDNTQEQTETNIEESSTVPDDTDELERESETERLRLEHEAYLNSFPSTTVFYQSIKEEDGIKALAGTTKKPVTADKLGFLENHMDESELSIIVENGRNKYYLKGYEKPEPTEIEKMAVYAKTIEAQVDAHLQELSASRGYDDVKSCVGYYNSTDETFQREAKAMTVYRDHLYRTCYNIMDQCQKGEIDYRTVTLEYILGLIEPIDW